MPSIPDLKFKTLLIYTSVFSIEVMEEWFEEMLKMSIGAFQERVRVEVLIREVDVIAVHCKFLN